MNIYSHLLSAALFAALSVYAYIKVRNHHAMIRVGDILGFVAFFFGVTLCLSLSALFPHYIKS